jgi:hypothetical protein
MPKHPCHYVPKFSKQANIENLLVQWIRQLDSKNDAIYQVSRTKGSTHSKVNIGQTSNLLFHHEYP